MCRNILLILAAVVALFFASLIAAGHYIGCWSIPLVLFMWLLIFRLAARYVFSRLALLPYTFLGRALKGARVQVHALDRLERPAPARRRDIIDVDSSGHVQPPTTAALPAGEPEIYDPRTPEDAPVREIPRTVSYRLDLTITPRHAHAPWSPAALAIVPAASPLDAKSLPTLKPLAPTRIELFRTFDTGGSFLDAPASQTCTGPQRLRLTFELPLTNTEANWKLLYHFLPLAALRLPD